MHGMQNDIKRYLKAFIIVYAFISLFGGYFCYCCCSVDSTLGEGERVCAGQKSKKVRKPGPSWSSRALPPTVKIIQQRSCLVLSCKEKSILI